MSKIGKAIVTHFKPYLEKGVRPLQIYTAPDSLDSKVSIDAILTFDNLGFTFDSYDKRALTPEERRDLHNFISEEFQKSNS